MYVYTRMSVNTSLDAKLGLVYEVFESLESLFTRVLSVPETEQYMYTKGRFLRGDVLCGYLFKRQSLALAVSLQAAPITPFPHSHNPLPLPAQMGSLNPEEENIS